MGLFDAGGFYQSFTPPAYSQERMAMNPFIYNVFNQQMSGQPTDADWRSQRLGMQSAYQNYQNQLRSSMADLAGRGMFNSGIADRTQQSLLGQRAANEAAVTADFWNNILARQMQAAAGAGDYVANARAGSGTYTQKG